MRGPLSVRLVKGMPERSALSRFFIDLWRSARRPAVVRRCALIAAVVGSLLTIINLGDIIWRGAIDGRLALRIAANFVVPFIVSNLGAMSTQPRSTGRG